MYVITEWYRRYEVNSDGREAKKGQALRCSALDFVRLAVFGHKRGSGYDALYKRVGGNRILEVFGLFCKLLEIAADQPFMLRGAILNQDDEPATAEYIAAVVAAPLERVQAGLDDLGSVKWIASGRCDGSEQEISALVRHFNLRRNWRYSDTLADFSEKSESTENSETESVEDKDVTPNDSDILADNREPSEPNRTEPKPNRTELNTTEDAHTRTHAREIQNKIDQQKAALFSAGNPPVSSDSARSSALGSDEETQRKWFHEELKHRLKPTTGPDEKALHNFEHWCRPFGWRMYEQVLAIADDLKGAQNRMAVFFKKVEKIGYRSRAERDKRNA